MHTSHEFISCADSELCRQGRGVRGLLYMKVKMILSYPFHFSHIKGGFCMNTQDIIRICLSPGKKSFGGPMGKINNNIHSPV